MTDQQKKTKCGYIAIIGRANVGKSTLLNALLGKKLVITSHKPQTTRHRILGIKTADDVQMLFLDTPGLHSKEKSMMNRYMNRAARSVLQDVDILVWLISAQKWTDHDELMLKELKNSKKRVILAINKVDTLKRKEDLLPFIDQMKEKFPFKEIIPISATKGIQLDLLEEKIIHYLPEQPFCYKQGQLTDCRDDFIASEMVREKLMRFLDRELPYDIAVLIDALEYTKKVIKISALILVKKRGQKAIVLGAKGERLKLIGTKAREELENYFDKKVFLKLWVKVKADWADHERLIRTLGHTE